MLITGVTALLLLYVGAVRTGTLASESAPSFPRGRPPTRLRPSMLGRECTGALERLRSAGVVDLLRDSIRLRPERGGAGNPVAVTVGGDRAGIPIPGFLLARFVGSSPERLSPRSAISDRLFGEGSGSVLDELVPLRVLPSCRGR